MTEYSLFREELKEKVRTKIFVNRVHNILDSYLDLKTDTKLDSSKKTEMWNKKYIINKERKQKYE